MKQEFEVEEDEFNEIVAENRHRELATSLKDIATILSNKNDKAVALAINGQGSKIEALVKAIHGIQKPEVKIEWTPKEFISSINKICEDIVASNNKVIQALNNRLLPDTFTLVKSHRGTTESVKVNYKEANKIANKK